MFKIREEQYKVVDPLYSWGDQIITDPSLEDSISRIGQFEKKTQSRIGLELKGWVK